MNGKCLLLSGDPTEMEWPAIARQIALCARKVNVARITRLNEAMNFHRISRRRGLWSGMGRREQDQIRRFRRFSIIESITLRSYGQITSRARGQTSGATLSATDPSHGSRQNHPAMDALSLTLFEPCKTIIRGISLVF
jgi:hypothetical protein